MNKKVRDFLLSKLEGDEDVHNALRGAEAGEPEPKYAFAIYLMQVRNTETGLIKEFLQRQSIILLKEAASQGFAAAVYTLADHYLNGVGVRQSTGKALKYYTQAARISGYPIKNMASEMIDSINHQSSNPLMRLYYNAINIYNSPLPQIY